MSLLLSSSIALAWTPPTSNPYTDTRPAPVNTSINSQTKDGGFGIGGTLIANLIKAYTDICAGIDGSGVCNGTVIKNTGVQFPDGSIQTTASGTNAINYTASTSILSSTVNGKVATTTITTNSVVPAGTIAAFNGSTCPAGWVKANGTNGTPDLRGEFIRGLDDGRGIDTGRVLASAQAGANAAHTHTINVTNPAHTHTIAISDPGHSHTQAINGYDQEWVWTFSAGVSGAGYYSFARQAGSYTYPAATGITAAAGTTATAVSATAVSDGSEARPRNVALLYCMSTGVVTNGTTATTTVTTGNFWGRTGDAGTSGSVNFLGTTDAQDLVIKTNNTERARVTSAGNVGIGTTTPSSKLTVQGGPISINNHFAGPSIIMKATDNTYYTPADQWEIYPYGIASSPESRFAILARNTSTGVPVERFGVSSAGDAIVNRNLKVGPFYFDGNDDTWIRLRDGDGGAYKDLAAGNVYASLNSYGTAFYYNSDLRLKENIKPLQNSLEKVQALKGYTFDWKATGKSDVGLIAQEVEKVFPALVAINPVTGMKSVEYGNLIAPIIESIKELFNNQKKQDSEIEELKKQVKELKSMVKDLKNK